jgi:hypothetical protein
VIEIKHRFTGATLYTSPRTNLIDALRDAVVAHADLGGADLRDADLRDADLRDAYLGGAYLGGADLRDADLRDADLRDAYLGGAYLGGAYLGGAYLRDADLGGADLRTIKRDLHKVLSSAPREVPGLRLALVEGRVDGSTYTGDCACLVGTIANVRGVAVATLPRDSSRPAERWFLAIGRGATPETNPVSAITLGWIDEWLAKRKPAAKRGGKAARS